MTNLNKAYHLVTIYLLEKTFYIVGSVEMPPIFVWRQVNPVYKVEMNNKEKLAQMIEMARLQSISRFNSGHDDHKILPWDGEKNKVWNHAQKSWSILWYEDGSVKVSRYEPYDPNEPDLGEGKAWRPIKNAKKILPPSVSPQDIAQEILSKIN